MTWGKSEMNRNPHLWEPDEDDAPERASARRFASGCAVAFLVGWLVLLGAFLLAGTRYFILAAR